MSFLEDTGVCKQSGCEAIALATGGGFTIVARAKLFDDFDMDSFAVTAVESVRSRLRQYLTSLSDIEHAQWLAGIIDSKINRTMQLEDLIDFYCSRLGDEISVFSLPAATAARDTFLSEANRPTRTRTANVVEIKQIESSQSLFQMTIANLSPALQEKLKAYTEPTSIILMSTVFVAVVALGSTPPWSGIIVAAMWGLIGWQAFTIGRMLGEAVALYLDGNLKACARKLADIIIAVGEVFLQLLAGLAFRLIRPAPRVPQAPKVAEALVARPSAASPPAARAPAAPPPPGELVVLSEAEYFEAMSQVFPSQYVDRLARLVDVIGQEAAVEAMANPKFVAAMRASNWKLAGTLFHSAAASVARRIGGIPAGWKISAEETIQAGSRLDLALRGPAGEFAIIDWKTTGLSALRSIKQMDRYAGIVKARALGNLIELKSASWVDYIRPLLGSAGITL